MTKTLVAMTSTMAELLDVISGTVELIETTGKLVTMTLKMEELLDVISGTVELLGTTGKLVEMTSEAVVLVKMRSGLVSLVDTIISGAISLVDGTTGTVEVGIAIRSLV